MGTLTRSYVHYNVQIKLAEFLGIYSVSSREIATVPASRLELRSNVHFLRMRIRIAFPFCTKLSSISRCRMRVYTHLHGQIHFGFLFASPMGAFLTRNDSVRSFLLRLCSPFLRLREHTCVPILNSKTFILDESYANVYNRLSRANDSTRRCRWYQSEIVCN